MSSLVIQLIKRDPLEIPRLLVKSILFFLCRGKQEEEYFSKRAKLAHFLARAGFYEKKHLNALKQIVSPGDNVLDIGANFGVYTRALSELAGPQGKVFAFEPVSFVFKALRDITSDCKNVEYFNLGVSDGRNDQAEIKMPLLFGKIPEPALSSLTATAGRSVTEKIKLTTLDNLLDKLPRIKYIKVDIEGHEKEFFEGAKELIRRDRPVIQFEANKFEGLEVFVKEFCKLNFYETSFVNSNSELSGFVQKAVNEQDLYLIPVK